MRVRRHLAAVSSVAALLLSQAAYPQTAVPSDTGATITMAGSATLTVPPDHAVIIFAVASRAVTAAQASALNAPKVRRLLAAMSRRTPAPDSVLVTGVDVGPNENERSGTIVDYQSSTTVRVVVTALDSLGTYLDVGLRNGATSAQDISFRSDSATTAYDRALTQAYGDAQRGAQTLAAAAGGSLGPLLHLTTVQSPFGQAYQLSDVVVRTSAAGVPIAPQGVTVSASITGTWRFEPHR